MQLRERFFFSGLVILISGFTACNKGQNCLTNTGKINIDGRVVGEFDSIYLNDNVNLILTQDTINKVSVEAGENIISGITTVVNEHHQLIIHNENSCNWLRNYSDPVNVYVSFSASRPRLYLYYNSSGNVRSTNLLFNDTIQIDTWGGCGSINLFISCQKGIFVQHMGTVDLKLKGRCIQSNIFAGDYGKFDFSDLETGYIYIKNYGTNNCYVRAIHQLDATVGSIGNIYYMTNPPPEVILKTPPGTDQILPDPGK
ncbi:MAG: DUF2807 domain-containing protein [Bacteroidota bacterium]